MRFLIPLVMALLGLGGGIGAGMMLRPAPAEDEAAAAGGEAKADDASHEGVEVGEPADPAAEGEGAPQYVKLSNQFVVPVVENGRVAAMVILSLSLEVTPGGGEFVYAREPRLRDTLLQVLFDHANAGGFRGTFTDGANLVVLRRALNEAARRVLGDTVLDVLISDIGRQDS